MDDLKLLAKNEDNLDNEITIVKAISKDINTNFGYIYIYIYIWEP